MAATGGEDPQTVDDIRSDAPLSVLTLGRAVSITDYQNYASTFAGIAKAYAIWIPSGPGRGVFLSVAAAGGSALPPGNPTLDNLITSLHDYGNPLIPIYAASFLETLFSLEADVVYDPRITTRQKSTLLCSSPFVRTTVLQHATLVREFRTDEICRVHSGHPGSDRCKCDRSSKR